MMTETATTNIPRNNGFAILRLQLCLLFLALMLPLTAAKTDDGIEFFVQVHTDKEHVRLGDSCTVTYLLYSSVPFQHVKCNTDFRLKHAKIRTVRFRPENTVQRIVMNGRRYYRMFWSQHVVCPQKEGRLKLPARTFKAKYNLYQTYTDGNGYYFGTPKKVEVKKQAANKPLPLTIEPTPRRTTLQMLQSGSGVL
ncbi:MAG: BatD family protein [Bacteroidaceae bacterium]|nr:BatD family protein [Bacteroidaceae bacterium]